MCSNVTDIYIYYHVHVSFEAFSPRQRLKNEKKTVTCLSADQIVAAKDYVHAWLNYK